MAKKRNSFTFRLGYALIPMCLMILLSFQNNVSKILHRADIIITDELSQRNTGYLANDNFLFLGVDEKSIHVTLEDKHRYQSPEGKRVFELLSSSRFPWSREVLGRTIERSLENGAELVMVDLSLSKPSSDFPKGDLYLKDVIDKYRHRVILASVFESSVNQGHSIRVNEPLEMFLGELEDETPFGFVNFSPDKDDDIIRQVNLLSTLSEANGEPVREGEPKRPSFANRAAQQLGFHHTEGSRLKLPYLEANHSALDIYPAQSISEFFQDRFWEHNYDSGKKLAGKVVMIGPSSVLFQDRHPTVIGQVNGAQLHLHALAAIQHNAWWDEIEAMNNTRVFWILAIASLVWITLYTFFFSSLKSMALASSSCLILWTGAIAISLSNNILFAGVIFPLLTLSGAAASIVAVSIQETLRRIFMHRRLSKSMSPSVAAAIVKAPDGYYDAGKGRRLPVTIVFTDLRGFTSKSEKMELDTLIHQLNTYLDAMVKVIFAHKGTVDKFIGDAIMATWGELGTLNPQQQINHALASIDSMLVELQKINQTLKLEGSEALRIGIGIHHGSVVVGEMGSTKRTDFTVIGDSVNLSARLESLTGQLGLSLLVSQEVIDISNQQDKYSYIGDFIVKGRVNVVKLYTLKTELENFTKSEHAIRQKDRDLLLQSIDNKEDKLSHFYKSYLERRPNWDGTFSMLIK